MIKKLFPLFIIIISVSVLGIVGYSFFSKTKLIGEEVNASPRIFYQLNVIEKFDATGQPIGRPVLMRKDGFAGLARTIFALTRENQLQVPMFSLKGDIVVAQYLKTFIPLNPSLDPQEMEELTLNHQGQIVQRREYLSGEDESLTTQSRLSPDGRYQVKTDIAPCVPPTAVDEPCYNDAQLTIRDKVSNEEATLYANDLAPEYPGLRYFQLWGFSPDNTMVYIWAGTQQEFYAAKVIAVDLASKKIKNSIWASGGEPYQPDFAYNLLPNGQINNSLFIQKFVYAEEQGYISKLDLVSGEIQDVVKIPDSTSEIFISPTGLSAALDGYYRIGPVRNIRFSDGQVTELVAVGDFLGWSKDGRYFAWEKWAENGELARTGWVQNIDNGSKVKIYEQKNGGVQYTNANLVESAKVGDRIYHFVGLY